MFTIYLVGHQCCLQCFRDNDLCPSLLHCLWIIYTIYGFDLCTDIFISFQQDNLLGADWRNVKGQVLTSGNGSKQPSRKQFVDSSSPCDSKSTEASTSMSVDELCAVDSASFPSTSRTAEVRIRLKKI